MLAALTLVAACNGPPKQKLVLRDSEGRKLGAACSKKDGCAIEQLEGGKWPGERQKIVVHQPERLQGVCNTKDGMVLSSADCRLLECSSDTDCPPVEGMENGSCVGGLCTVPMHETGPVDVVMLCMSGTGLGTDSPKQAERASLGLNCGSPCKLPEPCRKP